MMKWMTLTFFFLGFVVLDICNIYRMKLTILMLVVAIVEMTYRSFYRRETLRHPHIDARWNSKKI